MSECTSYIQVKLSVFTVCLPANQSAAHMLLWDQ